MFQDKKTYLDIIHTYTEVHATVHGTSTVHLPSYVRNYGILSGRDLQFLLRETKVRATHTHTNTPGESLQTHTHTRVEESCPSERNHTCHTVGLGGIGTKSLLRVT